MKKFLYSSLRRKIISLTLAVSLAPLLVLGATIYYQFEKMYREKIEEQIKFRSQAQAEAVDRFLKGRMAILGTIADTHSFWQMTDENHLSQLFHIMNMRQGNFVDIGVIDNTGQHRAYVGPYAIKQFNYFDEPWFDEVMSKGIHISNVYTGYRKLPHFIIAVRRQESQQTWVLRATIDPEVFGEIVRSAQVGKTGDAYIVNSEGIFQTAPRFSGDILSKSVIQPSQFGSGTTVITAGQFKDFLDGFYDSISGAAVNPAGSKSRNRTLYAGSWLKNNKWLLVISQEVSEEMGNLFATQYMEIFIILSGVIAIILTTVLTTRMTINHLVSSEARMNELNAHLMQSDKLAALGKMAAGVAHEINNPLAVILQKTGWMEDLLLEEEFQDSTNLEEFKISIRKIEEHVERARKVVHNMLGYARKMEPHLEDVDINNTIDQTIGLLENYARNNNIDIQTDLSSLLPIIASDQAQLQQVFLNLISNAIDAIGKDGLIEISSRFSGTTVIVSIKDDGPGIPEDKQKRIFDPFFTTKEAGKGTGLGLWVSYSIIEKLNGKIGLKSEVGKGATFTVEIPIIIPEKK
jgi:two-component system NtrC family sensor kinase